MAEEWEVRGRPHRPAIRTLGRALDPWRRSGRYAVVLPAGLALLRPPASLGWGVAIRRVSTSAALRSMEETAGSFSPFWGIFGRQASGTALSASMPFHSIR